MSTPGVRHPGRVRAQVVGVLSSVLGSAVVAAAVVWMNTGMVAVDTPAQALSTSFSVPTPPPPKPEAEPKPAQRRKRSAQAPRPAALLTAGLAGLDVGLPGFDADALAGTTEELLGEGGAPVMTEDTVDQPPRPRRQVAPAYPARARAKDIQGGVTLAVRVEADGRVGDVRVVQSDPPGVFDQAAVDAVRQWSFEPATYQGEPVALRMQIILPFRLE